jgi:hypothetical protein
VILKGPYTVEARGSHRIPQQFRFAFSSVGKSEPDMSAKPGHEEYWRYTAREHSAALERLALDYEADPGRRPSAASRHASRSFTSASR